MDISRKISDLFALLENDRMLLEIYCIWKHISFIDLRLYYAIDIWLFDKFCNITNFRALSAYISVYKQSFFDILIIFMIKIVFFREYTCKICKIMVVYYIYSVFLCKTMPCIFFDMYGYCTLTSICFYFPTHYMICIRFRNAHISTERSLS